MATVASIAKRRSEAETAIKAAVSALADKHGVEVAEGQAFNVRDLELRRVMDLETTASSLAAIVDAMPASKAKTKAEPRVEAEVTDTAKAETKKPNGNAQPDTDSRTA